jgi:beta-galactosidase
LPAYQALLRAMKPNALSRRDFVQGCAVGAFALASAPILGCRSTGAFPGRTGPANLTVNLDRDWLFGGKFNPAAHEPGFDDKSFARVTLPHCAANLSWQNWDPVQWADVWIYRRHFDAPAALKNQRLFLEFDAVMTGATPTINGHPLPSH